MANQQAFALIRQDLTQRAQSNKEHKGEKIGKSMLKG